MLRKFWARFLDYRGYRNIFTISIITVLINEYLKTNSLVDDNYFFIYFYWISIIVFMFGIYGVFKYSNVNSTYSRGGYLYNWYDDNIKWRGTEWIKYVFDKLISEKILEPSSEPIIFISPTANKGIYEKIAFEHLSNNKILSKFICCDLNIIDEHEQNVTCQYGEYIYLDGSNNAANLDKILTQVNCRKANIIWDSIGFLWHTKEKYWHKRKKISLELINILNNYNDVLNDNGLIIVDHIKSSRYQKLIRNISNFLSRLRIGFGEFSTGAYLLHLMSRNKSFNEYIRNNYSVHSIDYLNEFKTNISVLILKKK